MAQGYQVIEPPTPVIVDPVTVSANVAGEQDSQAFTVNIPKVAGGYTAVIVKRSGAGFVGPQGEFYPEFPKVSQLQVMYGK